ncbi:hypothetical protein SEA_RENNA12_27 [Arthrobacter phage Renna12]|nr:hypothetical protein SEA_RENNA12_27 [Arthrobacter phage Renna12]
MNGIEWPDVPRQTSGRFSDLPGQYASPMESTRTEIEPRHCTECRRTTPHEVHYMTDRSPSGITRREIGSGCTRCQATAD